MYICPDKCQGQVPDDNYFKATVSMNANESIDDILEIECYDCGITAIYCDRCYTDSYCSEHSGNEAETVVGQFSNVEWITKALK